MKVILISPYELGRQPFGLAEPAAWLKDAGCDVTCLDLSLQRLEPDVLAGAELIGLYVAMHTATRIAIQALPKIRSLAPEAHLCAYGLYAPTNEEELRAMGVSTILGGEFEPALLDLAEQVRSRTVSGQSEAFVSLKRVDFVTPDRSTLPSLAEYAKLVLPGCGTKTIGFVEASRGCKHKCRHCPVVPVYEGKFRIVQFDVVMDDIRTQVAGGAEHISFGDPDFLNGPTHAKRLVQAMHEEFPHLTYDATVKIQHLLNRREMLPTLKRTGCLFVTSAVESIDDAVLGYLDKNHTNEDFGTVVHLMRETGIALAPTFVAFTPWITVQGYVDLLKRLVELRLVKSVPPIQLAIRLLIPKGSYLMRLPDFVDRVSEFDPDILGYRWKHPEPAVDDLQTDIKALIEQAEQAGLPRSEVFHRIWIRAHEGLGVDVPSLPEDLGEPIPHHSEPWYCCAEPTDQQLMSF